MLLIMFLQYYSALNYAVPPFVPQDAITKGFLNMKLEKWIISTDKKMIERPSKEMM